MAILAVVVAEPFVFPWVSDTNRGIAAVLAVHRQEQIAKAQEALDPAIAAAAEPAAVVQRVQRTITAPPPAGARGREQLENGE